MKESKKTIFLAILFIFRGLILSSSCHDDERAALLTFKTSLRDMADRLSSWHGQSCCEWEGIECSKSGHVSVLDLRNPSPDNLVLNSNSELVSMSNQSFSLEGTLSPSLFTLKHIHYLDLSYNNFISSEFPSEISNLTKLVYLNLSNSMLSGSITTQLANLKSLSVLDLSCSTEITDISTVELNVTFNKVHYNALSKYINLGSLSSPSLNWLQNHLGLRDLRLIGLDLSHASKSSNWAVPISSLTNLTTLFLSNCKITNIPIEHFMNSSKLENLFMGSNPFRSPIPHHVANLTSLSVLEVTNSGLFGSLPVLPPRLRSLFVGDNPDLNIDLNFMFSPPRTTYLQKLSIDYASVGGEIPSSIGNMTSLTYFSAIECGIQGPLPSTITNQSKLQVLSLDLNNISGELPQFIFPMKNLWFLSLSENKLDGFLPTTICNATSLIILNLNFNSIRGNLPECYSKLPNLVTLAVAFNKLSGNFPISMFGNSSLITIMLGYNAFTIETHNQSFPSSFNPQALELSSSNIGGPIPDFISNFTNLEYLGLSNNSLSGSIPSWLLNLPRLSILELSMNKLEGTIPKTIQLHPSLFIGILDLADNKLQGPLPYQLKNITLAILSGNNFSGHVPPELGELPEIKFLSLANNSLSGEIPLSFCQDRNALMILDLSKNNLSGSLPHTVGKCTSLEYLDLHQNKLGRLIPEELGDAKRLSYLDLSGNEFNGSFPTLIKNFQNLESLNLASNKFEGMIPAFIGDLQSLRIVVLSSNFFSGEIPQEMATLQNMQFISLSNNRLSGPIPEKLNDLKTMIQKQELTILASTVPLGVAPFKLKMTAKGSLLQYETVYTFLSGIDLSLNNLTGKIPDEIGLLEALYMLNLSHNALTGEIPKTIGSLKTLESLDLSYNTLIGEIPTTLRQLNFLSRINLSYNNLSGSVPSGPPFDSWSYDLSAYAYNKYLCDVPGGLNCTIKASPNTNTNNEEDATPTHLLILIVLGGYVAGVSGFFSVLYLLKDKWRDGYWIAVDKFVLRMLPRKEWTF